MGRRSAFRTLKVKQFSLVLFVDASEPMLDIQAGSMSSHLHRQNVPCWWALSAPTMPPHCTVDPVGTGRVRRAISRWSPEMAKRCSQIVMSHPLLCEFFFSHSISPSLATTSLQFCNLQLAPWRCSALSITPYWSPMFRRRHGAIWINDDGKLGMSTNTGTLLNLNWIESWEIFRWKPFTIKQPFWSRFADWGDFKNATGFGCFWRIWQYWKVTSWSLSQRNV